MKPYYDDGQASIYHGDARDLSRLSADVIVTDPPYGLAFMGKAWDRVDQQFHQAWAETAYQALPSGGWLLAFGGTRTWHRLACGIEDAGFEVRDTLMWLYGSGFPKGKACLKPGWEPILLARKPGSNVLQIDACRVVGKPESPGTTPSTSNGNGTTHGAMERVAYEVPSGRWPANVALVHAESCQPVGTRKVRNHDEDRPNSEESSTNTYGWAKGGIYKSGSHYGVEEVEAWDCQPDCPVALLDQQSGESRSTDRGTGTKAVGGILNHTSERVSTVGTGYGDKGGASRFFATFPGEPRFLYTAKAGRSERVKVDGEAHPTVKPLALMRWLVRLVTPPGGTVLDPFCGSGSTLVAARIEGFRAIGIEADERWCKGSAIRLREHEQGQGVLDLSG